MISACHLIYIIPLTYMLGFVVCGILAAVSKGEDDEHI